MIRTYEDEILKAIIPDINWGECQALERYWGVYYYNPKKYKWLKPVVIDWLRNGDGKEVAEKYNKH